MKRVILLFLISFLSIYGNAQTGNVTTQQLSWFRYYMKVPLKNDWKFRTELEERSYMFPWHHHQFLSRSHMGKNLGKGWSGAFGMTFFWQTLPHDPEADDYFTLMELRVQQELIHKQKISGVVGLSQRFWLEERIFQQLDENSEPSADFDWGTFRLRYKFQADFNLWKSENENQSLKLSLYDELMINFLGQSFIANIFDQNRLGVDLVYNFSPNLGLGLTYMNWYQQRASGSDFFNRHIFRVTIHHTIPTKASKKI